MESPSEVPFNEHHVSQLAKVFLFERQDLSSIINDTMINLEFPFAGFISQYWYIPEKIQTGGC